MPSFFFLLSFVFLGKIGFVLPFPLHEKGGREGGGEGGREGGRE